MVVLSGHQQTTRGLGLGLVEVPHAYLQSVDKAVLQQARACSHLPHNARAATITVDREIFVVKNISSVSSKSKI